MESKKLRKLEYPAGRPAIDDLTDRQDEVISILENWNGNATIQDWREVKSMIRKASLGNILSEDTFKLLQDIDRFQLYQSRFYIDELRYLLERDFAKLNEILLGMTSELIAEPETAISTFQMPKSFEEKYLEENPKRRRRISIERGDEI